MLARKLQRRETIKEPVTIHSPKTSHHLKPCQCLPRFKRASETRGRREGTGGARCCARTAQPGHRAAHRRPALSPPPSSMMDRRAQRCAVIWNCCAVLSKTILPMPCHAMPHLSNVRRHRKPRQPCNAKVPETKTKEACLKRCADGQRNHVRQNGCFS
ncbi:unnamed protein product [Musa banksii]